MPDTDVHRSATRGKRAMRTRHPLRTTAAADHPTGSTPSLLRTMPLPGGRAVVGALLVTGAAVGVFAAYRSAGDGPSTPVVVLATDLPAGHRIEAGDLRIDRADLPPSLAGGTFNAIAGLEGAVTLAPLRAGELVQRSAVLAPGTRPEGSREFSFAVDRERALNGALQQGERVDVLATFGTGDGASTSVVARSLAVLEVDNGGKTNAIGASGKLTITVSMANADDILKLAHATQVAPITIVRATRAEGTEPGTIDTYHAPGGKSDTKPPSTATTNPTAAGSPSSASPTSSTPNTTTGASSSSGNRAGG